MHNSYHVDIAYFHKYAFFYFYSKKKMIKCYHLLLFFNKPSIFCLDFSLNFTEKLP